MKTSVIVRFTIIGLLWAGLVFVILSRAGITAYNLFVVFASAIIIFVPMYKKYVRNDSGRQ